MTANSAAATSGTIVSITVLVDHRALLATAMRSLPTSVGSAPKSAASKNTNNAGTTNAATSRWGTVSAPNHEAIGIEASTSALPTSRATMTRFRLNRSASAPAGSPNIRYGIASSAATSEVSRGEPDSEY